MRNLLMLAGAGVVIAGAALWLEGRQHLERRVFAGLIASAVALSLFSVMAWAATAIAHPAALPLTWAVTGALALLFALRLYRELHTRLLGQPR